MKLLEEPVIRDVPDSDVAPATPDLAKRLEARLFSLTNCPSKVESRFTVQGIGISTPGNLTSISAAVKSGKSAFIAAMQAAVLTQTPESVDCLGVAASNPDGFALLHFDTEQSLYDHHELVVRTLRRAGLTAPPVWYRSYCLTGFPADETRRAVEYATRSALDQFGGIHSVIIDGVADLVWDVNNVEQANGLVTDFHALAIEVSCPILGVIHLNPGQTDKTRGHLGSQLERKAETNLRLEKHGEVIEVWGDKNRRAPILKGRGPCFRWSDEHQMHVTVPAAEQASADSRTRQFRDLAEAVFAEASKPCLAWGEFVDGVMKVDGVSRGGARKKFDRMRALGLVAKNHLGQYRIA